MKIMMMRLFFLFRHREFENIKSLARNAHLVPKFLLFTFTRSEAWRHQDRDAQSEHLLS